MTNWMDTNAVMVEEPPQGSLEVQDPVAGGIHAFFLQRMFMQVGEKTWYWWQWCPWPRGEVTPRIPDDYRDEIEAAEQMIGAREP